MAARRPAAPPPTRSTSCVPAVGGSLTPELLVHQHLAVMVHDHVVDAAVVELLAVALASAVEAQVLRHEAVHVLAHELLARVLLAAGRDPVFEGSDRCGHGPLSSAGGPELWPHVKIPPSQTVCEVTFDPQPGPGRMSHS